jgi:hypothetical protein
MDQSNEFFNRVRRANEDPEARRNRIAATTIQRVYRGHAARLKVRLRSSLAQWRRIINRTVVDGKQVIASVMCIADAILFMKIKLVETSSQK